MELGLKGKIAIVSGASRGIGKAVAFGLAEEGASLAICSRTIEDLENTSEEIRSKTGREVFSKVCNITRSEEIHEFTSEVLNHYHKIDILVNNGGGPPQGTFSELPEVDWTKAIDLNLLSFINFSREVIPP